MTLSTEQQIEQLLHFRDALRRWDESKHPSLRTHLNQSKAIVRHILIEAQTLKYFTLQPPPGVVGRTRVDLDLLDFIFDPPWGRSVVTHLIDMIDEGVGVIRAGLVPKKKTRHPEKIEVQAQIQKGYAFVVMAIDPTDAALVDVLDAIKEASNRCGVIAERIDEVQANERITDRILESIRKAEFIVVDVTHPKPNVFYEAGYAQGIGKLPIYIARAGTALQFDLKDYPTIFFRNMKELKAGLEERLNALVDQQAQD